MSRIILCLTISLLGIIGIKAWANDTSAQKWSAEQQEIISILENGPMGIETDFEAWEDEFHLDWTVWFPGQTSARAKKPHMDDVRNYIERGAKIISYEADFADIIVFGETAVARFNAIETIKEPDSKIRIVYYGSTDYLIRVGDTWKIRSTTVALQSAPEKE